MSANIGKVGRSDAAPPGISVVIPTFRRPGELAEALQSVREQTLPPHEVIVVDGDKDGVVPLMEHGDFSFRYINDASATTAGRARNVGSAKATGAWVMFLDDDDYWHPELLAEVSARRHAGIVACWMRHIDPTGKVSPGKCIRTELQPRDFFARNPGVTGSNLALRRDLFMSVDGFDENLAVSEDKDLFIRLLDAGRTYDVICRPLVTRRIARHDHLSSQTNPRLHQGLRAFLDKHHHRMTARDVWRLRQRIHAAAAGSSSKRYMRIAHRLMGIGMGDPYALFR